MKIVSWNVNGLRAVHRNGFWDDFMSLKADIICLQEIKAEMKQLPDELQDITGYETLINSSKKKKGYSGVAIYTREKAETVEHGIGVKRLSGEGRVITAHYKNFTLCNVYFPQGAASPERLKFKLDFYDAFLKHLAKIEKRQKNIIVCGDVNTSHNSIDLARPDANHQTSGFMDIERKWIDKFINSGYTDIHRYKNPKKEKCFSWWSARTRARDRNIGWRLDYFFITNNLIKKVKHSTIHSNLYGSDHCPISLDINI